MKAEKSNLASVSHISTANRSTSNDDTVTLPNLCSVEALLSLVIFGQLLAIVLVVARLGLAHFSWPVFGLTTFLIEWVILCSVACICPLRSWLSQQKPISAVFACYLMVLGITASFSIMGQFLLKVHSDKMLLQTLSHLLIAAIILAIFLRYFFLRQRLLDQEQTMLESRIQALQSRIRPHFLFNSMNSIASLISIDASKAEQMVVDLAELFRASLKEPSLVPLSTELALCKRFVDIEQQRLGDRLRVNWSLESFPNGIPEGIETPSLMLQPLLENAIYHGIQPLEEGGEVRVEIEYLRQEVFIRVSNPRLPGAEAGRHTRHRKKVFQKPMLEGNGIAIDNIRYRLNAIYGPKASLRTVQSENEFTVIIRYPFNMSVKRS